MAASAGAGAGGDHHHYRHLLLHHLLSKQPTDHQHHHQQQQQFQYQFPQIPQQQELLNLQETQNLTHLNPSTITQIQARPIKKRALNSQGSGVSGRKPPGRRGGGGAGINAGEIVQVEGGHIIRSTGRKDRHSKVCTAKGPRDRRVRLSAHTAIQFYDVQDRLGYDRPSKAVDWLITKAKSAIDELEELPPWNPMAIGAPAGDESCNLLPPEMDADSIPATEIEAPVTQFQSYLDGRSRSRSQDLRLSLQSFQDPMMIQSNRNHQEEDQQQQQHQSPFGFDNRWNFAGAGAGGGFMFIPPPQPQPPQPPILFGHGVGQAATHFFTQRGTLQSNNNTPLVRAGEIIQDHQFPGIGFGPGSGGFSSFHIPARIQGDHNNVEEHDGNSKPSSVASTSRH